MAKSQKKPAKRVPRSGVAVAMFQRWRHTGGPMKDRRTPRGGARNREREYRDEYADG